MRKPTEKDSKTRTCSFLARMQQDLPVLKQHLYLIVVFFKLVIVFLLKHVLIHASR